MSCNDDFLSELKKFGVGSGRELEIGRQYYAIDGLGSYCGIRVRAFTVTGNGPKPDIWEGELALDRDDLVKEDGTDVTDEQWEKVVSDAQGGNWSVKSERAEWDVYDSPEEAREAAARCIERERKQLERSLEGLRSQEAALRKWDGVLCVPCSDQ